MSKISDLSDGGSLQSTDFLVAVRSGGNVKVQADDLTLDTLTVAGTLRVPNNEKLIFGTSSTELEVYYSSGPNVVLMDSPTAPLQLGASQVNIASYGGTNYAVFDSTGVDVTGTVTADAITISPSSGNATLTLSSNASQPWEVYSPDSSNDLRFKSDSTDYVTIDTSGKVGIGTTSPATALDVNGTVTADGLTVSGTSAATFLDTNNTSGNVQQHLSLQRGDGSGVDGRINTAGDGSNGVSAIAFAINGERMRIDSSGNVGIGTTSIGKRLTVGGSGLRVQDTASADFYSSGQDALIVNNGTANFRFWNNGSERIRIDSSGNLLVGTTSITTDPGVQVFGSGNIYTHIAGTGSAASMRFYRNNAQVGAIATDGTSTAYQTSSDARLKENIADAEDAASLIDAIQVRSFDWIADGSHQRYGMVAQELLEVAPEAVSGDPESDDMMGVDYSKLVPMLVKEIQSLRARVAQLEGA